MGEPLKKEDIRRVLEFYRALGLESVPLGPFPAKGDARRQDMGCSGENRQEKQKALNALKESIAGCALCKLSAGRKNIVFGEGDPEAALMFIGEAPGREEDLQGRPFVGDAGKLLTSFMERMGFRREDVFIANIAKCRPPGNRVPEEDEVAACIGFLKKQIEIIRPKAIMALGSVSAQNLLGTKTPISALKGKRFEFGGIPLVPTFHPAFLLRNPSRKWDTLEDALPVLEILGEPEKTDNLKTLLRQKRKT